MTLSKEKEQEYIEKVKQDGLYLKRIKKNQSYNICLEAVKQNEMAFPFVKEEFKTEELCLIAIKRFAKIIRYIENPTNEMWLEAIKNNGFIITDVKSPTEEMVFEAIKQNALTIEFIKNPTEEIKRLVIKEGFFASQYIKNQTEEMELMKSLPSSHYRKIRFLIKKGQLFSNKNPYHILYELFLKKN